METKGHCKWDIQTEPSTPRGARLWQIPATGGTKNVSSFMYTWHKIKRRSCSDLKATRCSFKGRAGRMGSALTALHRSCRTAAYGEGCAPMPFPGCCWHWGWQESGALWREGWEGEIFLMTLGHSTSSLWRESHCASKDTHRSCHLGFAAKQGCWCVETEKPSSAAGARGLSMETLPSMDAPSLSLTWTGAL